MWLLVCSSPWAPSTTKRKPRKPSPHQRGKRAQLWPRHLGPPKKVAHTMLQHRTSIQHMEQVRQKRKEMPPHTMIIEPSRSQMARSLHQPDRARAWGLWCWIRLVSTKCILDTSAQNRSRAVEQKMDITNLCILSSDSRYPLRWRVPVPCLQVWSQELQTQCLPFPRQEWFMVYKQHVKACHWVLGQVSIEGCHQLWKCNRGSWGCNGHQK